MFVPEFQPLQILFRATIDRIVSDRLGTTRVQGNAQPLLGQGEDGVDRQHRAGELRAYSWRGGGRAD